MASASCKAGLSADALQIPTEMNPMKFVCLFALLTLSGSAAERVAPKLEKTPTEEVRKALATFENEGKGDLALIRRGLISDQTYDRARCAQCLIKYGGVEDIPFLIDALSDESSHVGANYPVAGMETTRYWANVALIVICRTSYDYRWDAPAEKREYAISLWKQHWERIKPRKDQ